MTRNPRIKLLLPAICLLFCSLAQAKDYSIEVIFFVNKDGLSQTAEQFSIDQIIPVPNDGLNLFDKNEHPDIEITNQGVIVEKNIDDELEEPLIWQALPEEEYILNNVANKLKRSGRYRILKHIAWRQPVVDKNQAKAIQIQAGRDFTELFPERAYRPVEFGDTINSFNEDEELSKAVRELAGTIRVVITRYLHVYTDLVYRLPRTNPIAHEDALQREHVLVDYAVNSHRRMRSRELHYIDHPLVGILVEATPIEEDEEENL